MIDRDARYPFSGSDHPLGLKTLSGGKVATIYGQAEVVKDLIAARVKSGGALLFEADAVAIDNIDTNKPDIRFTYQGKNETLECDFIAGCDGFHGVSRPAIPDSVLDDLRPYLSFRLARHSVGVAAAR